MPAPCHEQNPVPGDKLRSKARRPFLERAPWSGSLLACPDARVRICFPLLNTLTVYDEPMAFKLWTSGLARFLLLFVCSGYVSPHFSESEREIRIGRMLWKHSTSLAKWGVRRPWCVFKIHLGNPLMLFLRNASAFRAARRGHVNFWGFWRPLASSLLV